MNRPSLLRGVDRAALAVALATRLRAAGVLVSADGPAEFVAALGVTARSRRDVYWAARLTLVTRAEDIPAFDEVFGYAFADAVRGVDPVSSKSRAAGRVSPAEGLSDAGGATVEGLPWLTRQTSMAGADTAETDSALAVPDVLPSRLRVRADQPFEAFDAADLRVIGDWLERTAPRWPQRRTRRREQSRRGRRIDLRQTMRASRTTGWEVVTLIRTRRRRRPRRIVFLCDVSRSMQPYVTVYLHLMRALAVRPRMARPEVFAFSTSLTRLTPALSHRSAEVALARANDRVADRYGGTHLGPAVADLVRGPHGSALRGAVAVIASDGWDADPPEVLERAMRRLRGRAERVVWLNPRAAATGFVPTAASMAAALPYCDVFLPAHSLTGLVELFDELAA
ncbi:hypothetical protein MCHIJ_05210 [Mycolicibacterium chitae]|uniref:VWA containing CoxE-like protein n=1 Tax=Mycolicibacterium chitae TaxID=1792 RepID=A0A3S4SCB4_MYCCI|nr:VWA domain-containing protein [Mycolicibacterium chitae]MCV7104915.1 VWA domain-containing protein [Mycolicibacterium chitae]BBZ01084.1 hypothetical protein MCHIJ_05210 [Mycolicibacterium chitae]VEG49924.1 VWA containing CoxE-like protein [Mycolicibacterium chitae]